MFERHRRGARTGSRASRYIDTLGGSSHLSSSATPPNTGQPAEPSAVDARASTLRARRRLSRVSLGVTTETVDPLYALKVKPLWRFVAKQGAAYWLVLLYVFFEYVRPQQIYPTLDVIPWSKLIVPLGVLCHLFALA